jgi:parvulin-like peptidyl-prolyl isomerase
MSRRPTTLLVALLLLTGLLTACGRNATEVAGTETQTPPATLAPPTPTSEPAAAILDGEPITLRAYQEELARYEAAQTELGIDLATLDDYQNSVLRALIDRRLLANAAREAGVVIGTAQVESRVEWLAAQVGGSDKLLAWLDEMGYTSESFMAALAEELLAAEMIALLTADLPEEADQVHARHILVGSRQEAESLIAQYNAGEDFDALARAFSQDGSSRPAGGDLGWFPEDFLLIEAVARAAFELEPGAISDVVESELGFHIVQTLERGIRVLSPDALRELRDRTIEDWLAARREGANLQILLTP